LGTEELGVGVPFEFTSIFGENAGTGNDEEHGHYDEKGGS